MLKLANIKKDYKVADGKVQALKGINLNFRKNEFVSVLGPSGCGKTTLLNLIGGLDRYTSGDMYINGISTKNFTDRDFDVYRNHRVGFVFQSYNLIPHQTVLSNVELALTIAGYSKEERTKKAKEALDQVGLHDQYYKKPNQLSGGQSQRVAIARALVNDPEILLADEPTGALDTKTSGQIMDLIKKIATDRLVIMVTHNPELAEKYSTRIVRLLDGELQSDSNPYEGEVITKDKAKEKAVKGSKETAKMSWWTTFKLSLQNLLSKKSRTILTSVASSIGIIGISLVLALSYGLQTYIDNMQDDMLSGNPITISESALDLSSFSDTTSLNNQIELIKQSGYVNINNLIEQISKRAASTSNMFVENDIKEEYIKYVQNIPSEHAAAVFLDYEVDISNNIYFDFYEDDESEASNLSVSALRTIYTAILKHNEATKNYASMISNFIQDFKQAPNNEEYLLNQYNLLDGKFARDIDEIMIVVNQDGMINDLLLAQLGYYTQEEFINIVLKATDDDRYDENILDKEKISYEDLMGKTFIWYPNNTIFNNHSTDPSMAATPFTYNAYSKDFINSDGGIELKISGILEPKESISYGSLESGFYYTEKLTNHIIETNIESEIVNYYKDRDESTIVSTYYNISEAVQIPIGLTFRYDFSLFDEEFTDQIGFVGKTNLMSAFAGIFGGSDGEAPDYHTITLRQLGGEDLASFISIYAHNLELKDYVIKYLDAWNGDGDIVVDGITYKAEDRSEIIYSDPLSIVFNLINGVLNVVTIALIGFTALSLFVSSVMIAVITYVSVVERIKEIGVIRSLGGRKRDVSNLFVAETAIIGLASGLIAIAFTYFASAIINTIIKPSVGANLAILPLTYAGIMILISILLTMISGLIPSRSAAKKDPVDALRSE